MDMTAQEPAIPENRGDGLDFRRILLGHVMPWIGAPEGIDLGFANHNSGKESHEDTVARPAVVSDRSAPKRPSGRAVFFPKGEGENVAPALVEVGSAPVVSAVVEGEISALPEGGEEGPHLPGRAGSAHSSAEAAKTQEGTKPPAVSQVSPPPVSPVTAVEATSLPSAQVSPVETTPITSLPSPPLTSPDSAWFAPTPHSESGSFPPPLARAGGRVATATSPARASNSAEAKGGGPVLLGSPGQGRAPAPIETEPPQTRAIPRPPIGETGGAPPAGIGASAIAEEPARSPVLAPQVVLRDAPGSVQAEARAAERVVAATREVTVVSAEVLDRRSSQRPAGAADRALPETSRTPANHPPQAPSAPAGERPASRPEQAAAIDRAAIDGAPVDRAAIDGAPVDRAAVDPADPRVSSGAGGDGRGEAGAAHLRDGATRPGGAEQEGDGPRPGLAKRREGWERSMPADGELEALRGSEGLTRVRGEERAEPLLGLREPIAQQAAVLTGVDGRNEGPAKGLERNEARPLVADPRAVLEQVEGAARKAARLSRVTVQLRPPELGTIQISVESRGGNLSAHFQASHPVVRAWLESNAGTLRSELSESGLPFQNMSFSTAGQEQGGQWTGERQEAPEGEVPFGPGAKAGPEKGEPAAGTHKGVAEWRA